MISENLKFFYYCLQTPANVAFKTARYARNESLLSVWNLSKLHNSVYPTDSKSLFATCEWTSNNNTANFHSGFLIYYISDNYLYNQLFI